MGYSRYNGISEHSCVGQPHTVSLSYWESTDSEADTKDKEYINENTLMKGKHLKTLPDQDE